MVGRLTLACICITGRAMRRMHEWQLETCGSRVAIVRLVIDLLVLTRSSVWL